MNMGMKEESLAESRVTVRMAGANDSAVLITLTDVALHSLGNLSFTVISTCFFSRS